jgi:hypothetical protein
MRLRTPVTVLAAGAVVLVALVAAGCSNAGDEQTIPPVVLGLLDTTAPTYDDGEVQIYEVHSQVELPVRRPKSGERPKGDVDPYPRAPFVLAKDTRITVRFTLSNLDDHTNSVELLLDPWNEFVHYEPGVVVDDEMTTPNFSGIDRFFVLPPKGRVEGIITPDDMVELATDLATAMELQRRPPADTSQFSGPALYNRAFNVQNRSSQPDVVLQGYIPPVVDGLTGFDLGLRTYAQAKVAVEIVIDIEDVNGDRVIQEGDSDADPFGRPGDVLQPPAPATAN